MCSLSDVNIHKLSAVTDAYERGTSVSCIASCHNLSLREVREIVIEMRRFRGDNKIVSNLSA